jgi:hypothetical protein
MGAATLFRFDPQFYRGVPQELLVPERLCELGPGKPNRAVRAALESLDAQALADGRTMNDADMASCCISGLWLLHDYLDQSHTISQNIDTTTGSFWHGIMHRREPDYSNAKYWFRRVGRHEVFPALAAEVKDQAADTAEARIAESWAGHGGWDAAAFVDSCEKESGERTPAELYCRRVAQLEWKVLFDFSYRRAFAE